MDIVSGRRPAQSVGYQMVLAMLVDDAYVGLADVLYSSNKLLVSGSTCCGVDNVVDLLGLDVHYCFVIGEYHDWLNLGSSNPMLSL